MAKKEPFTFESNLDAITEKIQNNPRNALRTIGGQLVREIKATSLKGQFKHRYKMMARTLQAAYGWDEELGEKQKNVVQIGFKMSIPAFVNGIMSCSSNDPIKEVVLKNADLIKQLTADSLDQIRREK